VASWRAETTAGFQLHHVAGGHFLNPAAERQVVQTIVQDLI
jgi:surfactin synthase thioesterase subunit